LEKIARKYATQLVLKNPLVMSKIYKNSNESESNEIKKE
jgi:hypothetical protein